MRKNCRHSDRRTLRSRHSACLVEPLESRVLFSTTFSVTNTSDSGAGSLRQAITSADQTKGSSVIKFAIGSGAKEIQPLSPLPTLTSTITIDGTTQPGYAGTPLIDIDGSLAGSATTGIEATGAGCIIRGLIVDNFSSNGIYLFGSGGDTVQGDYLGVSPGGLAAGNGAGVAYSSGILVQSPNDLIGGTTVSARNIISGNTIQGVDIYSSAASNIRVEGNYIGTNVSGTASLPNQETGVVIYGGIDCTIGGIAAGDGNVLSGNAADGIVILGGATGNVVQGNLVGTDATGLLPVPNQIGVEVDSPDNLVGGLLPSARNTISANAVVGVALYTNASYENTVEGNYIGTNISGTQAVGAQTDGLDIDDGATQNLVGGIIAAARNVISGNTANGVGFFGAGTTANTVIGNYIGTTASGLAPLGNAVGVISADSATTNTIGGSHRGDANLISSNTSGIILFGGTVSGSGTIVEGNLIGADANGAGTLPNSGDGVLIFGNDNTIGGSSPSDGNTIFGNTADAIVIGYGTGNIINDNTVEA
jgi:hypothetical protein